MSHTEYKYIYGMLLRELKKAKNGNMLTISHIKPIFKFYAGMRYPEHISKKIMWEKIAEMVELGYLNKITMFEYQIPCKPRLKPLCDSVGAPLW